jgi:hypothetical protein
MIKKVDLTIPRICRECGEEFQPIKPVLRCKKCTNESARLNRIKYKEQGKLPSKKDKYPFDNYTNEAGARFHRIQRELREAWKIGREAVQAHYDKQLKEIEELGILEWIYDRRDTQTMVKQLGSGKTGRPINTKKEYPSTKDMPY